jgi:sugar lactone lactonase YvrE
MRRIALVCLVCLVDIGLGSRGVGQIIPSPSMREAEAGRPGRLDGVWLWTLPDTPNGLRPTESWHATGSSPDGDIYVAGMDHVTNAALYRLRWRVGKLQYVGDARSASEAVMNWMPNETAQKFHTRPLWHRGKIFVATMDRSSLDEAYLTRRGFHWYAYDPATDHFADLSASEPGGSAVAHGNVVTLASDPARNVIYGAGVPTGEIYRYDVARGRTDILGRPSSFDQPYVYTGRVMWVDSRGRLYFTAGNSKNPSVYGHVHYYDPKMGFGERADWTLQDGQALEVGQCLAGKKLCIFSDDKGHVYRFDDDGPSWSYLGQIETGQHATHYIWLFDVTADASRIYTATSTSPEPSDFTSLYEFDLTTGKTRLLCAISELDPALRDLHVHTGYDAWDPAGRFYFASSNGQSNQPVVLIRIDPTRLKATLNKPG